MLIYSCVVKMSITHIIMMHNNTIILLYNNDNIMMVEERRASCDHDSHQLVVVVG
jgi:hypothetical protein